MRLLSLTLLRFLCAMMMAVLWMDRVCSAVLLSTAAVVLGCDGLKDSGEVRCHGVSACLTSLTSGLPRGQRIVIGEAALLW